MAYALKLFENGSDRCGNLLKDRLRDRAQLLEAVRGVADGHSIIDPKIVEDLIHAREAGSTLRIDQLTPREIETLASVAEGHSNALIAERLVLTKRAVEKHVNAIFAKLDLGDPDHVGRRVRAALIYLADRHTVSTG